MMADDGSRAMGQGTGEIAGTVTLREFVIAQLHALDERLSSQATAHAERFSGKIAALEVAREARTVGIEKAVDARFNAMRDLIDQRAAFTEEAVNKVEVANDKRFDSVNEFRAQLETQAKLFATKAETDAKFDSVNENVQRLENRMELSDKRGANFDGRMAVIVGVGFLVINYLLNHLSAIIKQ